MRQSTSKLDANQIASTVVGQTIEKHSDTLPANLEAAWEAWSQGVGNVDDIA